MVSRDTWQLEALRWEMFSIWSYILFQNHEMFTSATPYVPEMEAPRALDSRPKASWGAYRSPWLGQRGNPRFIATKAPSCRSDDTNPIKFPFTMTTCNLHTLQQQCQISGSSLFIQFAHVNFNWIYHNCTKASHCKFSLLGRTLLFHWVCRNSWAASCNYVPAECPSFAT